MTKDTITSDLDLRTGVKPYVLLTLCMLGNFPDILLSADFLSFFFSKPSVNTFTFCKLGNLSRFFVAC